MSLQWAVRAGSGSQGVPGPPGPGGTGVPAPNVTSTCVQGIQPNGNGPAILTFSGTITLPIGSPDYSHLKQISVFAIDPDGNKFLVVTFTSDLWSGSTIDFSGAIPVNQPLMDQSWEVTFPVANETGAISTSPFSLSVTVHGSSIGVSAIDLNQPWRDTNGAVHKAFRITPVLSGGYPQIVTFLLDLANGSGPFLLGWWPVTSPGWTLDIGSPDSDIDNIFYPTDPTQTPWTIYAITSANQSPVIPFDSGETYSQDALVLSGGVLYLSLRNGNLANPPSSSPTWWLVVASSTFTVATALPCPANDITGAQFNLNPQGNTIQYVLSNPGVYNWNFFQIQWTQPTFGIDPSYWVSFITVQKGKSQNGTCTVTSGVNVSSLSGFTFSSGQVGYPITLGGIGFKISTYVSPTQATISAQPGSSISTATNGSGIPVEVWNPAPDPEGSDNFPGLYWGRRISDSGSLTGTVGATTSPTTVVLNGDWPPDWTDPWVANPNDPSGATTDFVEYRFWLWCISILGMSPNNSSPGTITLQTSAWSGSDHGILLPVQQPAALDLQTINPYTMGDGLTGGGGVKPTVKGTGAIVVSSAGVDVAAASIDATRMQANAITAANNALAANSVVDSNVYSVGVNKLIYGTVIFTGNVVMSRGSAQPAIDLENTGMFLYSTANGPGNAGLTSQPYVAIQSSGIGVFSGANCSVTINPTAVTLWSTNGSTSAPYVQLTSGFLLFSSGSGGQSNIGIGSSQINITSGTNLLQLTGSQITLQDGSSSCAITASAITIQTATTLAPFIVVTATQVKIGTYDSIGGVAADIVIDSSGAMTFGPGGGGTSINSTSVSTGSGFLSGAISIGHPATPITFTNIGVSHSSAVGGTATVSGGSSPINAPVGFIQCVLGATFIYIPYYH